MKKNISTPTSFCLDQNYPNPFNPTTMINFTLPEAGKVTVNVYTESGQLVRTLVEREMGTGRYMVVWNGLNQSGNLVSTGIYMYRIIVQSKEGKTVFTETRRMTMFK